MLATWNACLAHRHGSASPFPGSTSFHRQWLQFTVSTCRPPHSHSSRTHLVDVHTRFILMLARCNAYRALSTCINSDTVQDTVHTRPPHLITSKVSIAHRKVPHTNPTRSHCEGKFRTALEQCEGVLPAQCAPVGSHCAGSLRLCSAMFALSCAGAVRIRWDGVLLWVGVW